MAAGARLTPEPASFILTLELDGEAFAALDALRRQHYPPERNRVPAHLTLFHRLPGERAREIRALLSQVAAHQKIIEIPAGEVKALERGVAVFYHSPQLSALRDGLASEWWEWLGEQDQRSFRPHVTLQNHVGEAEAHRARQLIAASARPPRIRAMGLHLWRYRDGPWTSEGVFRFR